MPVRTGAIAALLFFAAYSFAPQANGQDATARLTLEQDDSICILGGALPERMQHDGWLETLLHARHPGHQLTIRNLGFAADELTIRQRSEGFGTPDEHLTKHAADVVLAFFGFNESFAGEAGLEKFKQDLDGFIKHTLGQQYNGQSPPRLVLFTPIAHEDLGTDNLPDGTENNRRLAMYSQAMAEVAAANSVPCVDLFQPSQELYEVLRSPLTINGIHLNEQGNKALAAIVDEALFGDRRPHDWEALEPLRQAVLDKNFYWYHRYRTTDGYSTYGGRSYLKFVNDQTNREVMFRELEILDVMTANRDRRIWAVALGGDLEINDSNTPDFIPVITNKPGPGPNGAHLFQSGVEAIQHITTAPGIKVNLFASEEMFPEMINPVQLAFDTRGRLWAAVWPTYPHWTPKQPMNDALLILEDTDGDGVADECKPFADDLHNPTGFEFWNGGVLVAMAPDLLFLKDTDGDDRADVRVRVLHGLDTADTHHTANSFMLDPGGALYFQEGVFHRTQIETPYGPIRNQDACVWRFEPRTFKVDRYIPYGFANPHGHAFDRWGQDIVHDGTGAQPYHAAVFSGYLPSGQHPGAPQVYQQWTRPCSGTEFLSSRHFPDEMQGNLIVGNVIGYQGLLQYKIEDAGSSFQGTEGERLLYSSDPNFRPTDFEIGPDGALYFTEWQNPIIGHMQHNLRDPSRDKTHGRVYRVTYEGRPLLTPPKIAGESIEKLLDLLKEPENRVRFLTRIELSGRDTGKVLAAAGKWLAALEPQDPDYEHQRLEGLWLHQQHNVVNEELLLSVLASPDFRARAAAARVLCYWRDRIPSALALFKHLAADDHPRVRLEAVRAASFFQVPEALEVVVVAAELPTDIYLDYTRGETLRVLEPLWQQAVSEGREVAVTTEAGARYLLRNMPLEQLLQRERTRPVCLELLFRPGVQDEQRRQALDTLAAFDGRPQLETLLDALRTIDGRDDARDQNTVFDLVRLLSGRSAAELTEVRGELEALAVSARQPIIRQVSYVALMTIDGSSDRAWTLAEGSVASLRDVLAAVPLIPDASLQASLFPRIEPLLHALPPSLSAEPGGALGRYVRIELPRAGTLTLAEVEVHSEGANVARQGTATQKNVSHGGEAARAIDGNTDPSYGGGGQTHSEENTDAPWWELDLGEPRPIDAIVVYNRADGELGQRLDGFTLVVLDENRAEIFRREGIPAPAPREEFALAGGGPESLVRRAAMNAITSIRGQELPTFTALAAFVRDDVDRLAAVRALQRIPRPYWPAEEARPLIDVLLEHVRDLPTADRTSQAALDVQEFADALATLLPVEEAREVRGALRELGVRVVRIGTLPERMSYDQDIIAVAAGKPVEFIFENVDLMPHNLAILQRGALEEVGLLGEATALQPDAAARHFIPPSDKIMLASRLLQPRQSQRLSFTAPTEPGVYPIVCTYPGHWRRMYSALYVVEDLDEYLAGPEAYLASRPLPVDDELLKERRPRTEWKMDDLNAPVAELSAGRSFGTATQMFTVASCAACHKLNGAGNNFGPDLAKLDEKLTPADILQAVLEPSHKINEKFQTWIIETDGGQTFTCIVLEETAEELKVIENPVLKAEPVTIRVDEIVAREKSLVSVMPKGLLDKLTRDEILDLMALRISRGNRDAALFQGGGHEHEHAGGGGGEHGGGHESQG